MGVKGFEGSCLGKGDLKVVVLVKGFSFMSAGRQRIRSSNVSRLC